MFYDKSTGNGYRFVKNNGTYQWVQIGDATILQALAAAAEAQDTADGKRRNFINTPTPPYDVGDIWMDGSRIYVCTNAKTASQSYDFSDWTPKATSADLIANGAYTGGTFIDGTTIYAPQIYGGAILGVGANSNHFTDENQKQYNYNFYVNQNGALGIGYNSTAQNSNYRNFYVDSSGNVWLMGNIHMIGSIDWGSNTGPSGDADYDALANQIGNIGTALQQYMQDNNAEVSGLKDRMIETYYYNYAPALDNIPASQWTTNGNDERPNHVGDLFFNKETGYTYRFNSTIVNN